MPSKIPVVCRIVVGAKTVIVNIEKTTVDITANWVMTTMSICGLPPSYLVIQATDGASISALGVWPATV